MPEGTKERGGPERPAGGGRNIRRKPSKSTPETLEIQAIRPKFGQDAAVAPKESRPYKLGPGEVPEWSIGTVSKTVVRASVPWVRIPPSPPPSEALAKAGGPKGTRCFASISFKAKTTPTNGNAASRAPSLSAAPQT